MNAVEKVTWHLIFAAIAILLTVALTRLARRRLGGGLFLDQANSRSLHSGVIPKIGGLGLVPAFVLTPFMAQLAGLVTGAINPPLIKQPIVIWWACSSLMIFMTGVFNDRTSKELHPLTRLGLYLAAAVIYFFGPLITNGASSLSEPLDPSRLSQPIGLLIAWTFAALAFTNFFNFMDGMDGLAGSMASMGFGFLAYSASTSPIPEAQTLALLCTAVSASSIGFLLFNWPPARIFMGDTGSTTLGFSAVALGFMGVEMSVWSWAFPAFVFFPFWFDAGFTLVRRILRGERVWNAHREHLYQRAVLSNFGGQPGNRHGKILGLYIGLMTISGGVALLTLAEKGHAAPITAGFAALALLILHICLALIVERVSRKHPLSDASSRPGNPD